MIVFIFIIFLLIFSSVDYLIWYLYVLGCCKFAITKPNDFVDAFDLFDIYLYLSVFEEKYNEIHRKLYMRTQTFTAIVSK